VRTRGVSRVPIWTAPLTVMVLVHALPGTYDRRLTLPVVTRWYRAPELILGHKNYGTEIDIWAVG